MNKSYEGLIDDSLISIDEIYKIKNKVSYILIKRYFKTYLVIIEEFLIKKPNIKNNSILTIIQNKNYKETLFKSTLFHEIGDVPEIVYRYLKLLFNEKFRYLR